MATNNDEVTLELSDSVYNIRIVIPNTETMEIQIGGSDMVQELYHVLLERDTTCHRTCFKIYYENKPLDHFVEIRNIPNIMISSTFHVVEEPYNIREARIHVRHLRDILRSVDYLDAANGIEFASFSCLSAVTSIEEVKKNRFSEVKVDNECLPPEYLLPGTKEVYLKPLLLFSSEQKICALKNIAFSSFNPPPGPRKMKGDVLYLHVDTCEDRRFYITCSTRGFFVNSSADNSFNPDPSTTCRGAVFHSLFDLLSELSPLFRKTFMHLLKIRSERHIYERLPTSFQVYSWIVPTFEHTQDQIRADDYTQPHRIGLEDHVPGQIRDWNEELQTTYDMPRNTFSERLTRDRAKFKVYSDFLVASVRGSLNIVEGSVLAINTMDDPKTHMFIWNNIFFSLGFDDFGGDYAAYAAATADLNAVKAYVAVDHPKLHTLGMAIIDFRGLRLTAQSIIPGILERDQEESVVYGSFDSGKTVVSSPAYEEYLESSSKQLRIAPHKVWSGKEPDQYVKLYTSYESKGIIGNDGRHYLLDLLRTFPPDINFLKDDDAIVEEGKMFPRVAKHKLVTLRQELIDAFVDYRYTSIMKLASSLIQKHCLSKAGKNSDYSTPIKETTETKINSEINENGFLKDSETSAFNEVQKKIETIFKEKNGEEILNRLKEFEEEFKENSNVNGNEIISNNDNNYLSSVIQELTQSKLFASSDSENSSNILSEIIKLLNSLNYCELELRFNPDCYCKIVKHAPDEDLEAQRKLVASAAEFLLNQQIPLFIRDCINQTITPIDGKSICESLHSRGINLRYIGKVIQEVDEVPTIDYVSTILKIELLSRCARHIFQEYIRKVDLLFTSAAVAHFLNCLIDSNPCQLNSSLISFVLSQYENICDLTTNIKKSNKKKRKPLSINYQQNGNLSVNENNEKEKIKPLSNVINKQGGDWINLTQSHLWELIKKDAEKNYGYIFDCKNCDQFIEWSKAQKISIIRRFCIIVGIQLISKNYFIENVSKKSNTFTEADIYNLVPVVKHINPKSQDAHNIYLSGLNRMHQGYSRIGYELMLQAHNMMNNIYGPLHPDLSLCLRFLARSSFVMGNVSEALAQQHKALIINERCHGIDNNETVFDYINLAHYSFANLRIASSLKLIYRARTLLLVLHGENHPVMSQIDANIGIILYSIQEYDISFKYLQSALKLFTKYDTTFCVKTASLYHIMARVNSCRGDFRAALQMEKETFNIYAKIFGSQHERTMQSSEYLAYLTKQAVNFQRKMNDATSGGQGLAQFIPSLNIQPPTLQNIIEMLNLFNNFIFLKLETPINENNKEETNKNIENKLNDSNIKLTESCVLNHKNKTKILGIQDEMLD